MTTGSFKICVHFEVIGPYCGSGSLSKQPIVSPNESVGTHCPHQKELRASGAMATKNLGSKPHETPVIAKRHIKERTKSASTLRTYKKINATTRTANVIMANPPQKTATSRLHTHTQTFKHTHTHVSSGKPKKEVSFLAIIINITDSDTRGLL